VNQKTKIPQPKLYSYHKNAPIFMLYLTKGRAVYTWAPPK